MSVSPNCVRLFRSLGQDLINSRKLHKFQKVQENPRKNPRKFLGNPIGHNFRKYVCNSRKIEHDFWKPIVFTLFVTYSLYAIFVKNKKSFSLKEEAKIVEEVVRESTSKLLAQRDAMLEKGK